MTTSRSTNALGFAVALCVGCSEMSSTRYDDAQCETVASRGRVDAEDPGSFGLSTTDALAPWSLQGPAALQGSSEWFLDRTVTAVVTVTPSGDASEVEKAWGSGERLDPEGCPARLLEIPVRVVADLDTVGAADAFSILRVLPDGGPVSFDAVALVNTEDLAAELASARGTACDSVSFTLVLEAEGWKIYYGADCDDARGAGLFADVVPET